MVVGEPAPASSLREDYSSAAEAVSLSEFTARRAWLALERAERRLRGNRYKIPKFLRDEILGRGEFREGLGRLAEASGAAPAATAARAARYLREIAATHSPFVIDVIANAIHWLYRQGYGAIHYDEEQFRQLYALGQEHPLVFLPSHRSNLDHLVLQHLLWENDLPPNHTAGGINMNFFPIGGLLRRTGVFFIRRTFRDNLLYKFVLQSYIDYLIEKRFPLEWYLEGGRSRTGKLLPPRYGLLAYVIDSFTRGKADDVYLIPASIAYDQIQDVGTYADEQRGGAKRAESFGWMVGAVRSLRRRYGNIYLRFGEPVSVAKEFDADADEHDLAVRKLAFEVSDRINRVTPITPASLVTLVFLAYQHRAITLGEIVEELSHLASYVERRGLPTTTAVATAPAAVEETLALLTEHDIVTCFDAGPEPVYRIPAEQHLTAAYYRNNIVHYFVPGAIAELALASALEEESPQPVDRFWEEVMQLRDLLKFEFFFPSKDSFREEIRQEMLQQDGGWEELLRGGTDQARVLLQGMRPLRAHWALRPFLEAYQVVGDALEGEDPGAVLDEKAFLAACLALGRQYRLQGRITAEESVSQALFKSALSLAANRGLTADEDGDLHERRQAFGAEIRSVLRRANLIATLNEGRRAGLM